MGGFKGTPPKPAGAAQRRPSSQSTRSDALNNLADRYARAGNKDAVGHIVQKIDAIQNGKK